MQVNSPLQNEAEKSLFYNPERVFSFNFRVKEKAFTKHYFGNLKNKKENIYGHFSIMIQGIPVSGELKKRLDIPDDVPDFTIDLLTLKPEESLPEGDLNENTLYKHKSDELTHLAYPVNDPDNFFDASTYLMDNFYKILAESGEIYTGGNQFTSLYENIKNNPEKRVLMILGHGGGSWVVGEAHDANLQVDEVLKNLPVELYKHHVLPKYQNFGERYSALLFSPCNAIHVELDPSISTLLDTDIYYVDGLSSIDERQKGLSGPKIIKK